MAVRDCASGIPPLPAPTLLSSPLLHDPFSLCRLPFPPPPLPLYLPPNPNLYCVVTKKLQVCLPVHLARMPAYVVPLTVLASTF